MTGTIAPEANGEKKVRPFDKVKVVHNGTSGYHMSGQKEEIHPALAEKLYVKGLVSYAKEDDKPKGLTPKAPPKGKSAEPFEEEKEKSKK